MTDKYKDYYKYYIDEYGIESQRLMCIEEMSELTKELCKIDRYKGTEKESAIVDNICEEIADVLNMAEQLEYYYGIEKVENIRKEKFAREFNHLNKK